MRIKNYKFKIINSKYGFALVEVLLVVLIVGFLALLISNLPSSLRLNSNSKYQSIAKQIASKQIETLRQQTFANLSLGTTPIVDTRLSTLPSGSGEVTIADCPASVCPNNEQLKLVTIKIQWVEENSNPKSATLETLIGEGGLQ